MTNGKYRVVKAIRISGYNCGHLCIDAGANITVAMNGTVATVNKYVRFPARWLDNLKGNLISIG